VAGVLSECERWHGERKSYLYKNGDIDAWRDRQGRMAARRLVLPIKIM
jgi:hypothetical protein